MKNDLGAALTWSAAAAVCGAVCFVMGAAGGPGLGVRIATFALGSASLASVPLVWMAYIRGRR